MKIQTAGLIIQGLLNLLLLFPKQGNTQLIREKGQAPLIIAHGGAKKLFPENTMIAFDGTDAMGVDMLEMDVVLTKDNVLITHHNESIDNTTEAKGAIKDYTYEELKKFNFGYRFIDADNRFCYRDSIVRVTALEDVLVKYGKKYLMTIELKNKDNDIGYKAADELYRLLLKYRMEDKVIISCFEDNIIQYWKTITKGKIKTAAAKNETKKFVKLSLLRLPLFYKRTDAALQIPIEKSGYHLDKKRIIRDAHRKKMAVHYWTINDPEVMKRLIQSGADGIITDRPDIMKAVLKEMGFGNN